MSISNKETTEIHQALSVKENVHGMMMIENSDDSGISSSSSSSDLSEDTSSSLSSSSSSSSSGPLYELSELMSHLPIKRGLSKYYHGKSQSFASLASVTSVEDLAKKESSYNQRMKACRSNSYGGGLDNARKYCPKAIITKISKKPSFISSLKNRAASTATTTKPSISIQKNL